jgi:ABC-type transport system involved in cytochrome bd biosynthesis fused ATPase/permease subunit
LITPVTTPDLSVETKGADSPSAPFAKLVGDEVNISRTWKWILAVVSAIILIANAARSAREILMWDFWKNLSAWHFFAALAVLTLIALGISWLKDRLDFRFASVAKAIADLRKEIRDGLAEVRREPRNPS